MILMSRASELDSIAREIEKCRQCKINKTGKAVPGEGSPDAKVVFIGEAPGKKEAQAGRPFIGRSGKFLRETIRGVGLKEEDVFITSPVKYLPVYGTPKKEDIAHGRIHLLEQLNVIKPKIIVLLGSVACKALLEKSLQIKIEHGKIIKNSSCNYFITYHPAAIIRFPKLKGYFLDDFKKLKRIISK